MPRLDLLIAHNTGLSRKQVVRLFRSGRVASSEGSVIRDAKTPIAPADLPLMVSVDHQPVQLYHRYDLMLHKPTGCVTAHHDARHPTAYALVRHAPLGADLRAVGRLDKETSGLLFWTTDGTLLHRITHPRYAIERTYHAALDAPFTAPQADLQLDDGHRPTILALEVCEAEQMHPALAIPDTTQCLASITIASGRFHEVRRIFRALGANVIGLARVRYGPITLPTELGPGEYQPVDLKGTFRGIHPEPHPSAPPSAQE